MRTSIIFLACVGLAAGAAASDVAKRASFVAGHPTISAEHLGAADLPRTAIAYRIDARLDPETRDIAGKLHVTWRSPATEPLAAIPIHLYLNAFSYRGSTWMREGTGRIRFDERDYTKVLDDPWGFIDLTRVVQVGAAGEVEATVGFIQPDDGNPFDRTLAEVTLAEPVAPGAELELSIDFSARLPIPMARTGGIAGYYHAGQWFPKIGMYEAAGVRGRTTGGWAARQFHGSTEFYAEFADFDVTIDAPDGYTVLATGAEQPKVEVEAPPAGRVRTRYVQRAVHDFTWVAARDVHVETHPYAPAGGGPEIAITYAVPSAVSGNVAGMRLAAETTFDLLGERVGPYPYGTMTIVAPPYHAFETAGMEYQTFVTDLPGDPMFRFVPLRLSEDAIAHEIAHNYFQGIVASDEQREAFLDEGFSQYWGKEAADAMRTGPEWEAILGFPTGSDEGARSAVKSRRGKLQESALQMPTNLFYPGAVGAHIYLRSRLVFETAERRFGRDAVDAIFKAYFERWRFRHPGAADFFAVVDEVGPEPVAAFLREALPIAGVPDYAVEEMESAPWSPPIGWLPAGGSGAARTLLGKTEVGDEANARAGLDVGLLDEAGGTVMAVVTEPGWVEGATDKDPVRREGRVVRRPLQAEAGDSDEGWEADDSGYHTSSVLLRGPGWRHLPVDVWFRFADGTTLRESWPGRSTWRRYEFLRAAPLVEVRVDPEDELVIDADPSNNGRRREPSYELATPLGGWLGLFAQWLSAGVGWL